MPTRMATVLVTLFSYEYSHFRVSSPIGTLQTAITHVTKELKC